MKQKLASACNIRKVNDGFICVCNSSYCDKVPELQKLIVGYSQIYYTTEAKPGFNTAKGNFTAAKISTRDFIRIDPSKRYQKILGFGGAFTDATGINIKSLPKATQKHLIESYFGKDGIEYSLGRVPIGGTDFSTRAYTYDDYANDTKLRHFQLQKEDYEYKIPLIHEARTTRGSNNLKLLASAWTAPPWMKTNNVYTGYSLLKDEYYQLWADYMLKFFDQYQKHGVKFWGVTTGNEPVDGFFSHTASKINAMGWVPSNQVC
ncbi:hypothetical protein NQ315_016778 [Exocentrus adspersus]|uniref:Glucosylceramidase n=1 Tax=Exocentrus adspersus TaxID=1586481 RepID=A0AAV8VDC1_9CUCU|nr:hypothetical protein NQ315_016778 [Exocentrus adspersus]